MKSPLKHTSNARHAGFAAGLLTLLLATGASAQFDDSLETEESESPVEDETESEEQPTSPAPSDAISDETTSSDDVSADGDAAGSVDLSLSAPVTTPSSDGEVRPSGDDALSETSLSESEVPSTQKLLWQGLRSDNNRFGFDGAMEMDIGYADYRFDTSTYGKETFHDFRGRFDLTPTFEHRFGEENQAFLRLAADFRAWLRDEFGNYQINVYEAYVQTGLEDVVDLQVGRLETWRVILPGNGFDVYTIEDTGALKAPPFNGGQFYTYRYEADYIWLADTPGRASLHVYPLKKLVPEGWGDLGIELTGEYGKARLANIVGGRGAAIYDNQWLRLAGAMEYRSQKNAEEIVAADGTICDQCTWQYRRGMGASAIIRPPYIVGGLNTAKSRRVDKGAAGDGGSQGITDFQMQGAFIELHTGHLLASTKDGPRPGPFADQRSENIRKITVGYGQRRAEQLIGNGDFERHTQQAVYLKYNLGFNESYLKLVGSYAKGFELDNVRAISEDPEFIYSEGDLLAARLRFAYFW